MRLAYDLSVLRHPPAGTARYATELLAGMEQVRGGDGIQVELGFPRTRRGGPLRRPWNLGTDLAWLTIGAALRAAFGRVDAWFSPANVLPLVLPRPMVVSILDSNVVAARGHHDPGYAAYATRMFRSAGRRARAVLALSHAARERLELDLGIPAERIVVAYPGIDHCLRVQSGPAVRRDTRPYALFVSQTDPHKNVPRLVEAWAAVPGELGLVIAGPAGRDEEPVMAAIERSPVRARIERLGRVPDEALARLYDDARCFVFPSLAEGFGFPPLEAMARHVPTAVSDLPVLREVTAGAALTFDPAKPEAIASAVVRISEDESLRRELLAASSDVVPRYRWAETARIAWETIRGAAGG